MTSSLHPDRAPGRQLVVTRVFAAPAEPVFDAWLNPASAGRWLFATPTGRMMRVELDPRVGGKFIITEKRGDMLAEHRGTYVEIDRPRRLAFTFAADPNQQPTRVTVEIASVSGGCELTLTHEIDPQWIAQIERVRHGWTAILAGLADTLSAGAQQQ